MENEINIHLGKKLKHLRKSRNITQEQMAVIFDIGQQNYCRIEKGDTYFSSKILSKIEEVFGLKPLDFMYSHLEQDVPIKASPNGNYVINLILNQFRRYILELQLRNIDLEIEVRKYRTNFIVGDDGPPVHVII